jgi:DNA repair protein SbcD/Mre11
LSGALQSDISPPLFLKSILLIENAFFIFFYKSSFAFIVSFNYAKIFLRTNILKEAFMRILHTSDWHLGKALEQINRIDEQREFIDCLCKTVEEKEIDLILIAGDIYDTYNPSAAAEELFYDAINRLNNKGKRGVVVIAGNHDNPERLCAASPLAYKNGIILLGYPKSDVSIYKMNGENIKIIESGPGWFELCISGCEHNAVILTLPYPSEARLEEILSSEADEGKLQKAYSEKLGELFLRLGEKFRDDTVNLAISHLFLRGGSESESERTLQVGGALTVAPEVLPAKAHFIALGHLHRPQKVKGAPCQAYYSGSPLAYSFSEADYVKAIYFINAEPGKEAIVEPLYLDCGKPLKRWKAVDGIEQAIKWCEEGKDPNAWIDLEVHTDRALTMAEQKTLRELNPGILNIRPVIKHEVVDISSYVNRENRKIDELFKDYYKHQKGMEISEELFASFIEVLSDDDSKVTEEVAAGGEEI